VLPVGQVIPAKVSERFEASTLPPPDVNHCRLSDQAVSCAISCLFMGFASVPRNRSESSSLARKNT
jgi:hypothetical protein